MPFLQLKFPVERSEITLPGWIISKHKPHVTLAEFFIVPEILDQVIQWIKENPIQLELEFTEWYVFYCKKNHFAVLAPKSDQPLFPHAPIANPDILAVRRDYLNRLLDHFQCECSIVQIDGLPIYKYGLFSFNRYNHPGVWVPHVTVGIKFNHLEQRYTIDWPPCSAKISGPLEIQVLNKPAM